MAIGGTTTGRRWLLAPLLAVVVVVLTGQVLHGRPAEVGYLLLTGLVVSLCWWGALRRPGYRMAACWVALAVTMSALGDATSLVLTWADHEQPFVGADDVLYLGSYVCVWLAFRQIVPRSLTASGRPARLDGVLDAAVAFVLLAYVEWQLTLGVMVGAHELSPFARAVGVLYPTLDAAIAAIAVGFLVSRRTHRTSLACVALAAGCWFGADLTYLLLGPGGPVEPWIGVGWLLAGVFWAVAIWRRPPEVGPGMTDRPLTLARVALPLLPVLVPGLVELAAYSVGEDVDPVPGLVVTALLLGLAAVRAASLLRVQAGLRATLDSQARYSTAVAAHSSDAVVVLDEGGRLVRESAELARLMGDEGPVAAGTDALAYVAGDQAPEVHGLLERAVHQPGRVLSTEFRRGGDGDPCWIAVRMVNLLDDPDVCGVVVALQDVTERVLAQQELAHHALHDTLTGLANRVLFDDRLQHALRLARRSGTWPVVLYLDLDRFKAVNDTLGHSAGDALLRETARRFLTAVRSGDTVARLGGDEFAILLEEGADPQEEAEAVAERLLATLRVPFDLDGHRVRVSASIGMAVGEPDAGPEGLLRDADIAMYGAKASGKGRLVRFDAAMRAATVERARLETDLPEALEQGQFRLVYQPVVVLESRRVVGFEALLRWHHPTLGEVPPASFIPIAESAGRMGDLGRWVLLQACATVARWRRAHDVRPLSVAVNVSGRQLGSEGFTDVVAEALAASGLRPDALVLELTETALVQDAARAAASLARLKALGVRLAIDDFGTGYSSLSYLRQFPVDILKIDRSFVAMADGEGTPAILRGTIELARTLDLEIVAEGVETERQHEHLLRDRCDHAQGFLYAAGLEADEAELQLTLVAEAPADT